MNSRVRQMLRLAVVLAIMRFVAVPWIGMQADTRERLEAVTGQLDRAEAISIAGSELELRRDAFAASVAELTARAPLAQAGSEYRLQVQRELRAAVESAGLKLNIFEWVLDGEAEATGLSFGRVRLQLEGSLRNLAEAHVDIEAGFPNVFVRDLEMNVRGGGRLDSVATATMELDLFYRRGDDA